MNTTPHQQKGLTVRRILILCAIGLATWVLILSGIAAAWSVAVAQSDPAPLRDHDTVQELRSLGLWEED